MTTWRKSSYSGAQTECVEVGNAWRKSGYSGASGECVEVGNADLNANRVVVVRDTKDRDGAALAFGAGAWRAFAVTLKAR